MTSLVTMSPVQFLTHLKETDVKILRKVTNRGLRLAKVRCKHKDSPNVIIFGTVPVQWVPPKMR